MSDTTHSRQRTQWLGDEEDADEALAAEQAEAEAAPEEVAVSRTSWTGSER